MIVRFVTCRFILTCSVGISKGLPHVCLGFGSFLLLDQIIPLLNTCTVYFDQVLDSSLFLVSFSLHVIPVNQMIVSLYALGYANFASSNSTIDTDTVGMVKRWAIPMRRSFGTLCTAKLRGILK